MPFSEKVKVMVWGLQGARCAFAGCNKLLVVDIAEDPPRYSLLGAAAHIIGENESGPRGKSALTLQQRNLLDNAILMCMEHHKIIDDHPDLYPGEKLIAWKKEREQAFKNSKDFDMAALADRALYAEYVDEWVQLARVAEWEAWTSYMLGGDWPRLDSGVNQSLQDATNWIFSRIWPNRYPLVADAFTNFRIVLTDLLRVFHQYSELRGDQWQTRKFYKNDRVWLPEEEYCKGLFRYDFHVDLVTDLVLELTRAANYVCDAVRKHINPEFRMREGVLTVEAGPYHDLSWKKFRPEYRAEELVSIPYPGLKDFKVIRTTRSICFGSGLSADDADARKDLIARRNLIANVDR